MAVRAKFTVQHIRPVSWSAEAKEVFLGPQYDAATPEDQRYARATPSGSISMVIDNPPALAQFEQGKAYYVDFTPAQ